MSIYTLVKVKQNDAFAIIATVVRIHCTSYVYVSACTTWSVLYIVHMYLQMKRVETKCARKLSLIWIECRYGDDGATTTTSTTTDGRRCRRLHNRHCKICDGKTVFALVRSLVPER